MHLILIIYKSMVSTYLLVITPHPPIFCLISKTHTTPKDIPWTSIVSSFNDKYSVCRDEMIRRFKDPCPDLNKAKRRTKKYHWIIQLLSIKTAKKKTFSQYEVKFCLLYNALRTYRMPKGRGTQRNKNHFFTKNCTS